MQRNDAGEVILQQPGHLLKVFLLACVCGDCHSDRLDHGLQQLALAPFGIGRGYLTIELVLVESLKQASKATLMHGEFIVHSIAALLL